MSPYVVEFNYTLPALSISPGNIAYIRIYEQVLIADPVLELRSQFSYNPAVHVGSNYMRYETEVPGPHVHYIYGYFLVGMEAIEQLLMAPITATAVPLAEVSSTDNSGTPVVPHDRWGVGTGPWNFTKQYNKWAYLNNPRWLVNGRVFVHGGPDDYNGRESLEPQLWTPTDRTGRSRGTLNRHHQCGHWHQPVAISPTTLAPTTIPFGGFTYEGWLSCPQFILPSPDTPGQVWYITSLDDEPDDYFRVIEYFDGAGYYWDSVYNFLHTDVESWEHWQEPDGGVAQRGAISVVAFIGNDDAVNASSYYLETWVFNNGTLLNHTITPAGPAYAYGQIIISNMDSKLCAIDSAGNIHVALKTFKGGVYRIYDFRSTDNGASFNPVLVRSGVSGSYNNFKDLGVFSDGTLYIREGWIMLTSADNGATWGLLGGSGDIGLYMSSDTCYINDTFFTIGCDYNGPPYNDVLLLRSVNGLIYSTVLTIPGLWTTLSGCDMLYDGTYYYLAVMFRNSTVGKPAGYTRIYRSDDGITWVLISTIVDESQLGVPSRYVAWDALLWPTQIIKSGSDLFYCFYYGSMSAPAHGGASVYLMSIWKSSDSGVTWETVHTPYYDLTRTPASDVPCGAWG